MSAPPTPMFRPSTSTPSHTNMSIAGPSTSNIHYICDHFRSLDVLWRGWVDVACRGIERDIKIMSVKEEEDDDGDCVPEDDEDMRRQRAIWRLAEIFKHCYVTPLVTCKLADAPTPLINRSRQKGTANNANSTTSTTTAAAGWGCFDDAVADDEAPPILLSIPTSQTSHHHHGGGKRPRDEVQDHNGDDTSASSPLLFRGSDVLHHHHHVDTSSPGSTLVAAKGAMDVLLTSIEHEQLHQQQNNGNTNKSHRGHHRHGAPPSSSSSTSSLSSQTHYQLREKARLMLLEGVSSLREMGGTVPDELGDIPGRPLITMRNVEDAEESSQHQNRNISSQDIHTPLYDLYVYEQLLPSMGVGLDASAEEVPPALCDINPLAAWLKICEMAVQECQAGAPANYRNSSSLSSVISPQEIAILKSESTAPPPLPLLLPLVLFVVLGFSNASMMERRLLQLLRRERRARKCAADEENTVTISAVRKDDDAHQHQNSGSHDQSKKHLKHEEVEVAEDSRHQRASSTVKAPTPTSTATYVKTKRGCLSLVCDDDDEDDEVVVHPATKVEATTEPFTDEVSKVLNYATSQDELGDGVPCKTSLSSHTSTKTTITPSPNDTSHSISDSKVAVASAPPPPRSPAGNQTPLGRKSILSVSDNTSPRQHPPRPPRSPSVSSSDDADDGLNEDVVKEEEEKDDNHLVPSVASDGDAEASDSDDDDEDKPTSPSDKDEEDVRANAEDNRTKKSHAAEVADVEDFSSASDDDDDVLGLCSDSSFETSDDDDTSKNKKKACAKCHSTKGDRTTCPRCKLQFHEKCGGPHPREEDDNAAEFTQLMKTVTTADLSKKEVFGRIAGNFWGDGSDDDDDGVSPHDRRLTMAATMVCVGCCAEQGLSAYRNEPASTPTHSDSGSTDDDDDDEEEFSTDSSDIRAAELEEALDTSKIEKQLALLRGPKYDPMKAKIKNDKLLLLTQMAPSDDDDNNDDGTDEEEIARRDKKLLERKIADQIAEENLKRRGCKYIVTEAAEEASGGEGSSVEEEDHPRRQKAEKGFLRHKRQTEERVKRIRGERKAKEVAAAAVRSSGARVVVGTGGAAITPSTPSNHPDVVIISPDTSQRPTTTTNPPPSSSSSSARRAGGHHPRRRREQ